VLDNSQLRLLGMDDMPTWQEALREYMIKKQYIEQGETIINDEDYFSCRNSSGR